MNRIDRSRYDMLLRLRGFAASHGQLFPDPSPARAAFAVIATEVDRLDALEVAERSASQAARVARKAAARKALAGSLVRAASTARVVARLNPALDARIELPLPYEDRLLLSVARQFTAAAAPCAADFAAHGLPLAEVEAGIAAFEVALHERGMRRDETVKARAETTAAFGRALQAVATLDVAVANGLAGDPVALAVWRHDRRIGYPRARGKVAAPDAAPLAPAAAATSPEATVSSAAGA